MANEAVIFRSDMPPRGARREIAVLSTDIADFGAIRTSAEPDQVIDLTSRYFAALSGAITATQGVVDMSIGGVVTAIWNAPKEDAVYVLKACGAILACLDASRKLDGAFAPDGRPEDGVCFGLHVGEAIVGEIGACDGMRFTALGAAVDLASHLKRSNEVYGTSVLVSEDVRNIATAHFVFRCVDRSGPRGLDSPIFELRCRRGPHTETEAAFCREWDRLFAALADAGVAEALAGFEGFLDAYPDDRIAVYHARRWRSAARLVSLDARR
jgi:adenylate cyclase